MTPLSTYLGKPGNPERGGIRFAEYKRRQASIARRKSRHCTMCRCSSSKARDIYGYSHFVCDSGGSLCEVVDPADPSDPVLERLADNTLLLYIEGTEDHARMLVERFRQQPKPMYYQPSFLDGNGPSTRS